MCIEAKVFVTTYKTGNEKGFATGKWFDLSEHLDKESFIDSATEYAQNILGDEDPELCFSDNELSIENNELVSESHVSDKVWEYLKLDNVDDIELLEAYTALNNDEKLTLKELLEKAQDYLIMKTDNVEDLAEYFHSDELEKMPSSLSAYVDLEKLGNDIAINLTSHNDFYFDFS